ncbi:MAG: twin-arginine translocase TatA/TatE family subunit [Coriobacteriaceae bacterium]|nr:twin-arginine translocase TatA/TatE family subunit [Coriobacteriaceae bacterium]
MCAKGSTVFGIGSTELILILFFGFLIFGPEKLPQVGRTVGRAIRQFRTASEEANKKIKEEVYDPFMTTMEPVKDSIEEQAAPLSEDIASINSTLNETKDMFKDPFNMSGMKETFTGKREPESAERTLKKVKMEEKEKQSSENLAASLYGLDSKNKDAGNKASATEKPASTKSDAAAKPSSPKASASKPSAAKSAPKKETAPSSTAQTAAKKAASKQTASKKSASASGAAKQGASKQTAPKKAAAGSAAPKKSSTKTAAPKTSAAKPPARQSAKGGE